MYRTMNRHEFRVSSIHSQSVSESDPFKPTISHAMSDSPCLLCTLCAIDIHHGSRWNNIRAHNACLNDEFKSLSGPGNNSNACVTWKFSISVSLLIIFFFFFVPLFSTNDSEIIVWWFICSFVYIVLFYEYPCWNGGARPILFRFFLFLIRSLCWRVDDISIHTSKNCL